MWELVEHRVVEDFDALTREDFRVQRAEDAGLPLVQLWRTEYARWDDPYADEPDKLGTIGVAWKLVEKPCKCGFDPGDEDDFCVCDGIADALGGVLEDWDVRATSEWEASCWPVPWGDETEMAKVWVVAHERYEFERDTRYDYSLHVEGVSAEVRREVFAAVGVKEVGE